MSINASLIGQLITFLIVVWFCMKFIWPRLMDAIRDRQKVIAEGLSAADRSQREWEATQQKIADLLQVAKQDASSIIDQANQRAQQLVEQAKQDAVTEAQRILTQAKEDIEHEAFAAKQKLYDEVANLAILSTEKLLAREINHGDATRFVNEFVGKVR